MILADTVLSGRACGAQGSNARACGEPAWTALVSCELACGEPAWTARASCERAWTVPASDERVLVEQASDERAWIERVLAGLEFGAQALRALARLA